MRKIFPPNKKNYKTKKMPSVLLKKNQKTIPPDTLYSGNDRVQYHPKISCHFLVAVQHYLRMYTPIGYLTG